MADRCPTNVCYEFHGMGADKLQLRPCALLGWAFCNGNCEKCQTTATTYTPYGKTLTYQDCPYTCKYATEMRGSADMLQPKVGTECLICGRFVEGWAIPSLCPECRKRIKNMLYAPIGQLNPEEPFRELNCTMENDGTYRGGEDEEDSNSI